MTIVIQSKTKLTLMGCSINEDGERFDFIQTKMSLILESIEQV